MGSISNFDFEVETIRSGQPRPYADSEHEYIVRSDLNEYVVKKFCTTMLKPCSQTIEQWDKNNAGSYFAGYYSFSKISDGTYKYYVKEPFCD